MATAKQMWVQRVGEWKRSGLTLRAFAAANGLKAGSLSYWSSRIGKEARAEAAARKAPSTTESAKFVELPSSWWRAEAIEIVIDDEVTVRVPNNFDEEALGRVLSVLNVLEVKK